MVVVALLFVSVGAGAAVALDHAANDEGGTSTINVLTASLGGAIAPAPRDVPAGDGDEGGEELQAAAPPSGQGRLSSLRHRIDNAGISLDGPGTVTLPPQHVQVDEAGPGATSESPRPRAHAQREGISESRVRSRSRSKRPSITRLSSEQIRSGVSKGTRSIRRCYEREMRRRSSPVTLRLNLSVTVGRSGAVDDVTVRSSSPMGAGLSSCVDSAVRRWTFPPARRQTRFETPISLRPR